MNLELAWEHYLHLRTTSLVALLTADPGFRLHASAAEKILEGREKLGMEAPDPDEKTRQGAQQFILAVAGLVHEITGYALVARGITAKPGPMRARLSEWLAEREPG